MVATSGADTSSAAPSRSASFRMISPKQFIQPDSPGKLTLGGKLSLWKWRRVPIHLSVHLFPKCRMKVALASRQCKICGNHTDLREVVPGNGPLNRTLYGARRDGADAGALDMAEGR